MKRPSILLVLFIFSLTIAFTSSSLLYSLYYQVIGNANFDVHFATIETTTDVVSISNANLVNVYSSYQGLASAYDSNKKILYWSYPNNDGSETLFTINTVSQFVTARARQFPNSTLDLQFNPKDSKLYGLTTNGVNTTSINIVSYNPANLSSTEWLLLIKEVDANYVGRSALDYDRSLYYVLTSYSIITADLNQRKVVSYTALDATTCGTLVDIFYLNSSPDLLVGISVQQTTQLLSVVYVNPQKGNCQEAVRLYLSGQSNFFDAALDAKSGELSILTVSGIYLVNLSTRSNKLLPGVDRYNPQYFTALTYA